MKAALAIVVFLGDTTASVADSKLDGLWKPIPIELPDGEQIDPYTCDPMEVNGAIPIEGNSYGEMEGVCMMANPTPVRGLDGTLFDVTCSGDWGSRTMRQLFMLYRDQNLQERLLIVSPHGSQVLERCPD